MKTFRVVKEKKLYCYADIQAENKEEAIVNAEDGSIEFTDDGDGNWDVNEEMTKAIGDDI